MWATHACRTFELCWLFDCNSNCNRFIFNDIIFRFEHEPNRKPEKKTIIIIALLLQLVLSTSVIYRDSTKSHRNSYIVQSLFSSYYLFVHCPLFALVMKSNWTKNSRLFGMNCAALDADYELFNRKKMARRSRESISNNCGSSYTKKIPIKNL